jgi:hypothetical protein
MSYTESYNDIISDRIRKRIDVDYDTDKDGRLNKIEIEIDNQKLTFHNRGSKDINIDASIPIKVDIHVDTKPFDKGVSNINSNIDLLTGAVVASEAAQVQSIYENSEKVGSTIVNGFFSYIRSEISQQISELTQSIDSQLMHLRELSIALVNKKKQMFNDFERISSRYIKIFDELNSELSNRIYELDKPTFLFKKETDKQAERSVQNDLVNTTTVFGLENSDLHTRISTSIAKKRAYDTLAKARKFLSEQNILNKKIHSSMINENYTGCKFAPICFVETQNSSNQYDKTIYSEDYINYLNDKQANDYLVYQFSSKNVSWKPIDKELNDSIKMFFNSELSKSYDAIDSHSLRVKDMILKMISNNTINVIKI